MTCGLCLDVWTEPRTLSCLHTFCVACLEKLIDQTGQRGYIDCPSCRTHIQVSEGGAQQFQKAFIWNSMKDTVDKFKALQLDHKPNCTSCQEEGKQTDATHVCIDCMQTLCTACLNSHNKFISDHKVMACDHIDSKELNSMLKSKDDKCQNHPEKKIKFYCMTCCDLLCTTCAIAGHEGHTKQEIDKVVETHKGQLEQVLGTLTHRVQH